MLIAQIPSWVAIAGSIAGSFGIGTLFGNLISLWFTSNLQRKNWIKDNKKQEWRELIDVLREALRVMMAHRYENYDDNITTGEEAGEGAHYRQEAIRKGYVAIGDRIFIVKKVRDSALFERWVELGKEYEEAGDASIPEGLNRYTTFVKHSHKFQDDLIQFSREDLGLD